LAACAHTQPLSDAEVIRIAERHLKAGPLADTRDCSVMTYERTWFVNCQARGKNVLDGGIYVTIDRQSRRVIKVRVDG
jgi:hypothetical protein